MTEERDDDVVVLIDENGVEEEFEYIDSIEMDGNEYVVLSPVAESQENADDEFEEEVVILRVETKENGEESFVTVDEEKELDAVFEEFKSRIEDEFSFDFDEEDEDFEDEDFDDDDEDDEE